MAEKFYVTQEGYDNLVKELDDLVHVVRPQVIVELQEARAQGDLSENADYDAARDHQAQVEAKIAQLEAQLKIAEIIQQEVGSSVVRIGSTVTVKDLSDDSEMSFKIVGSAEADPFSGSVSNDSPFAQAVLDHVVGDTVLVEKATVPYEVQILHVE
jgi:transcription elongation factor GreA